MNSIITDRKDKMKNFQIDDFKEETEDIIKRWNNKEDFVYYTSGSTGVPKKIVHSLSIFGFFSFLGFLLFFISQTKKRWSKRH